MKWKDLRLVDVINNYFDNIKNNGGKIISKNFCGSILKFIASSSTWKSGLTRTITVSISSGIEGLGITEEWCNISFRNYNWTISHYIAFKVGEEQENSVRVDQQTIKATVSGLEIVENFKIINIGVKI